MAENDIKCEIRKSRRQKNLKIQALPLKHCFIHNYDNIRHDNEIYVTNITYIPVIKDYNQNLVFLSVVISYKTKEIVDWKLSKTNDTGFVLDSFQNLITKQIKNIIVHFGHGSAYSLLLLFSNKLSKNNWMQSMSRVENSLDSRVIEFWFSILKKNSFIILILRKFYLMN